MTDQPSLDLLERRFLSDLASTVEAEAHSRTGLITKAKQSEANRASRALSLSLTALTEAYLNRYLASTRGIDAAIEAVEDDPTVDHDIEPAEEWTDA